MKGGGLTPTLSRLLWAVHHQRVTFCRKWATPSMEGAWKAVMRQQITVKLTECGIDATKERCVVRSLFSKGCVKALDSESVLREFRSKLERWPMV